MGVGDDWADRMAEEKEAARLRKKELRELRLGTYRVAALLLVRNKLTQILNLQKSTRGSRTSGNHHLYLSKRTGPVNKRRRVLLKPNVINNNNKRPERANAQLPGVAITLENAVVGSFNMLTVVFSRGSPAVRGIPSPINASRLRHSQSLAADLT